MYLHFITFVFIQFFTNCCLICCRQSHPGFVCPSVIVLCFLHLHIITESYQNFSVSQFINRGSLIKLSCQPLLDFSSFFLLCLIIPLFQDISSLQFLHRGSLAQSFGELHLDLLLDLLPLLIRPLGGRCFGSPAPACWAGSLASSLGAPPCISSAASQR